MIGNDRFSYDKYSYIRVYSNLYYTIFFNWEISFLKSENPRRKCNRQKKTSWSASMFVCQSVCLSVCVCLSLHLLMRFNT